MLTQEERITVNKKLITIGTFDTPEEASFQYEIKKKELHYCPARLLL